MIILDVEKYCHECPVFEADVHSYEWFSNDVKVEHRHHIRCKYRDRCRAIKGYLEKENKNA